MKNTTKKSRMKKFKIYYDEEGDYLEITRSRSKAGYFNNLGDGLFQQINEKTGEVVGVAIVGFKKRSIGHKPFELSIPAEFFQTISSKPKLRV